MKMDLRTGRIEPSRPSPTPYDLARTMTIAIHDQHRARGVPYTERPKVFDRMGRAEQQLWLAAAQRTLRELRL